MRAATWWMVLVLGLPGCLYLEGINEAPEVELREESIGPYHVGDQIWVTAQASRDPDGDALYFDWTIEHGASADDPTALSCGVHVEPGKLCFVPAARVTYTVSLRVEDDWGATTRALPLSFYINNRPPTADIQVVSPAKDNNHFVVGREIWFLAGASSDPDAGDALSYTWIELLRPQGSSTAEFVMEPCDANRIPTADPDQAVFLKLIPDYPGTYSVRMMVSDGEDEDSVDRSVEVDADAPPCLGATDPDYRIGRLLFDRSETRRLEVTSVTDDLDPYPAAATGTTTFRWLISDGGDGRFMEIGGYPLPYLDLDGTDFALGQQVRVRVVAEDRVVRDLSACPENQALCAIVAGCFQWVTWDLEFR
jgi:hypothetical protein